MGNEKQICIVSPHEKGFYDAAIYNDGWYEDAVPDAFMTGKIGGARPDFEKKVKEKYPDSQIVPGVTGFCDWCQEEHFEMETECESCGENVSAV